MAPAYGGFPMKSKSVIVTSLLAVGLLFCLGAVAQQATPTPDSKSRKHRSLEEMRQMFHDPSKSHEQTSPKIQNPGAAQALNPPILAQIKAQKASGDIGPGHTMGATGDGGTPAGGSTPPPCDPAAGGSGATPTPAGQSKDKDKDHHHGHSGGGTNPAGASGQPCGNTPTTGSNPPGGNPTGGNPTGGNPSGSNPPAGTPGS